jgi:hypothetical protein
MSLVLSGVAGSAAASGAAVDPLIQIRDLIYKIAGIFQADNKLRLLRRPLPETHEGIRHSNASRLFRLLDDQADSAGRNGQPLERDHNWGNLLLSKPASD